MNATMRLIVNSKGCRRCFKDQYPEVLKAKQIGRHQSMNDVSCVFPYLLRQTEHLIFTEQWSWRPECQ